jgi:voltage-gated potassium channel
MSLHEDRRITVKRRVFEVIEKAGVGDRVSRWFDLTIMGLIVLSVVAVVIESFESLATDYDTWFRLFEVITVLVFTIEYLLRLWTADIRFPDVKGFRARVRYVFTFMALIDLFSVLPFYLPFLLPVDLRFLRILRLTRMFRVFKLNRYSRALSVIGKVTRDKKEELSATMFIMSFLIVISATLIYYVENAVQPDAFPNIIASLWWAIATLTTVGYGDVYPMTGLGKLLASVVAVTGIGLVALPTGIISSGFMEEIRRTGKHKCPKCGEEFTD